MPALILLVSSDPAIRHRTDVLLSECGHLVASAASLQQAKRLLDTVYPDLVIADVRLDAFNGLHIALRCRSDHPLMPVIITHNVADPILQAEAQRLGAAFIVKPLDNPEFLQRVTDAIEEHRRRQQPIRRWPRKQVGQPLDAELAARRARIFDVSYGGLRLAMGDEEQVPKVFDLTVPARGLTVRMRSVWTFRSPVTDEVWCGAELIDGGARETTGWRELVDATDVETRN
jgi:DNA-binding NtrC family response regulator